MENNKKKLEQVNRIMKALRLRVQNNEKINSKYFELLKLNS